MRVLVLGATGLLGTEVMKVLSERGLRPFGAARSGADFKVDVTSPTQLFRLLCRVDADAVINCAANVDLAACEADPDMAYRVNTAPAGVLSAWSSQTDGRFIQVSTDHYFSEDGALMHDEHALVSLMNIYAASKFAAEGMARQAENALVVRTNICGARKGFGRWVLDSLVNRAPMNLFTDYFTSTMHVRHCAEGLADLLVSDATGLVNLASGEVSSKADFVRAVAEELGIDPDWVRETTAGEMQPARAQSCGLDIRKVEEILGRDMPTLKETVSTLVSEDARCAMRTTSPLATAASA